MFESGCSGVCNESNEIPIDLFMLGHRYGRLCGSSLGWNGTEVSHLDRLRGRVVDADAGVDFSSIAGCHDGNERAETRCKQETKLISCLN